MSTARLPRRTITRTRTARVALLVSALLLASPLALGSQAAAAAAAPPAATAAFVDLGTAATYSVLAGTGVTNTGAATVLALDLGVSPGSTIIGFPPGTVTGAIHVADAPAATAQADRQEAYDAAVAQESTATFAGDQAGQTVKPGVRTSAAAISNSGTMTLDADGDPSAVFVFQINAALSTAAASKIVLTDGALANNVFWQVNGAVSAGAGAELVGTFLATGAISFGEGASLKGRALTPAAVTLANSPVTQPIDDLTPPVVTIDGGAARSTNDTTPSISGTTTLDEPVGTAVTVTVAGQTLRTAVGTAGVWAVSAAFLAEGTYDVVASITDASRNTGTASQVLTVDVTAHVLTIDGGLSRATNDTTPTISGTTNEPGTPTVSVTVAGQTLTTTASATGVWSVLPTELTEAHHSVVATVVDPATNTSTASQVLTVDVTVPVVTIDGGPTRSTTDTSPWTYGTTAEQAGTVVHVTVGGQSLTATVHSGGTWGVSAETLAEGAYTVVASVTDAAQNTGTATQTLTVGGATPSPPPVDPVPPVVPDEPAPRYRPDAEIRPAGGAYVGEGIYESTGQRVIEKLRGRHKRATFELRVTNRGDAADRLTILGTPRSKAFKVAYLAGGEDVTAAVVDGSYRTENLRSGESVTLTVKVTRLKSARKGSRRTFRIQVASAHAPGKDDTVAAVVKVAGKG